MGKGDSAKPAIIILVCGILGLILCAILQVAYDNGYLIDLYITSADELIGLQIGTILLFLLCGGAIGAISQ